MIRHLIAWVLYEVEPSKHRAARNEAERQRRECAEARARLG